jgi:hypothetical protein
VEILAAGRAELIELGHAQDDHVGLGLDSLAVKALWTLLVADLRADVSVWTLDTKATVAVGVLLTGVADLAGLRVLVPIRTVIGVCRCRRRLSIGRDERRADVV